MKISCIDKEVSEILQTGYYQVPRFQRPYSWEKEHVEDFWQDSVVNSEGDYFIGSIVVFKADGATKAIVDGQQRLTTISMLLCAIRNAFRRLEDVALAQGIQKLIERPDINNREQFVLQTETSYPYFQEHIQKFEPPDVGPDTGEEEHLLQNAFELLSSYVDSIVDSIQSDESIATEAKKTRAKQRLSEVRDKILALKLIFIELDNEDDAYLVFETLNTRGKDLTAADLVKNHLAKLVRTRNAKVDVAKDKWNSIVATLEESETELKVEEFLHHFWLSQFEYVTAKKLFKAIRKQINRADAKDFLDTLVEESKCYRQIMEPTFGKWKKEELPLQSSLLALNLFRVKQQIPMVLSTLREYRRGGIKLKHAINVLQAIENFHFTFTAITSQRSSGGISFMYALHARNLLSANTLAEKLTVLKELKTKLRSKVPSYQEFEANFSELAYSEQLTKQKKLVQYVLSKFAVFFTDGVAVDPEKMTIEHLASQRPTSPSNMTAKDIACIGNLLLVDEPLNKKLKNKTFEEKQPIILRSNAPLDDKIREATNWEQAEIQGRTRCLAKSAYEEIWRIS